MKTVDRIIFDALAARRGVVLPDVGTLEVRRVGARRISDTRIAAPQNELSFAPEWGSGTAGSLVSMIAADQGLNESEASSVYREWLDAARREDGSVDLGAVGEVRDGEFVASKEMLHALNPAGNEVMTVEPGGSRGSRAWVWIVALVAVALAALCLLRCCNGGAFPWNRGAKVEQVAPAVTPLDAADVAEAEAARAATAAGESAANAAGAAADAGSAGANAAAAAGSKVGGYTGTDRFHVIVGAFAIESNADKYMARLKREHPELTPVKLPHPTTGYSMVSILQAATERQAVNKRNLYWDLDPGLWIYEQK